MGCKRFAQGGCAGTSWPALTSSVGFLKCRRTDESSRDPQTPLETPVIGAGNFEGGAGAGGGRGLGHQRRHLMPHHFCQAVRTAKVRRGIYRPAKWLPLQNVAGFAADVLLLRTPRP